MSGGFLLMRTWIVLGQLHCNSGLDSLKGVLGNSGTPCSEINYFSRDERPSLARGLFFTPRLASRAPGRFSCPLECKSSPPTAKSNTTIGRSLLDQHSYRSIVQSPVPPPLSIGSVCNPVSHFCMWVSPQHVWTIVVWYLPVRQFTGRQGHV